MDNKIKVLIESIPIIKNLFDEDVCIEVTTIDECVYISEGMQMKPIFELGIIPESKMKGVQEILKEKKTMKFLLSREQDGIDAQIIVIPIFTDNGEIIGTFGISKSIDKKVRIKNISEELMSSLQEINTTINQIADSALKLSYELNNVIQNTSKTQNEINESKEVIELIHSVSRQSNLLGLNASIEAARAGEAGRGFTVVAKEVENLAVLSKESTQKISNLISEVQTDIEKAVIEVTTTNASIDEQATSLKLTNDSFNLIQKSVFEVTNKIKEVAIETEVINENAITVEKSINNIANIIEQNAANTEEVASATEEQTASIQEVSSSMNLLADLSNNLQNAIDKFKV